MKNEAQKQTRRSLFGSTDEERRLVYEHLRRVDDARLPQIEPAERRRFLAGEWREEELR